MDKRKAGPGCGAVERVAVLVERIQLSAAMQGLENSTLVATSAISGVDIVAAGLYSQCLDGLRQQCRYVINSLIHSVLTFGLP